MIGRQADTEGHPKHKAVSHLHTHRCSASVLHSKRFTVVRINLFESYPCLFFICASSSLFGSLPSTRFSAAASDLPFVIVLRSLVWRFTLCICHLWTVQMTSPGTLSNAQWYSSSVCSFQKYVPFNLLYTTECVSVWQYYLLLVLLHSCLMSLPWENEPWLKPATHSVSLSTIRTQYKHNNSSHTVKHLDS